MRKIIIILNFLILLVINNVFSYELKENFNYFNDSIWKAFKSSYNYQEDYSHLYIKDGILYMLSGSNIMLEPIKIDNNSIIIAEWRIQKLRKDYKDSTFSIRFNLINYNTFYFNNSYSNNPYMSFYKTKYNYTRKENNILTIFYNNNFIDYEYKSPIYGEFFGAMSFVQCLESEVIYDEYLTNKVIINIKKKNIEFYQNNNLVGYLNLSQNINELIDNNKYLKILFHNYHSSILLDYFNIKITNNENDETIDTESNQTYSQGFEDGKEFCKKNPLKCGIDIEKYYSKFNPSSNILDIPYLYLNENFYNVQLIFNKNNFNIHKIIKLEE